MRAARRAALTLCIAGIPALLSGAAPAPTPWNLELSRGRNARSTVTVRNRCKATHTFDLSRAAEMTWLTFPGKTALEVPAGGAVAGDVRIDTAGLDTGEHEGEVSVRCRDCAAEPLCTQDLDLFRARLKVLWPDVELQNLDPQEHVAGEILAVLESGEGASRRSLKDIEKRHGLRVLRSFDLPSIARTVAVFGLGPPGAPLGDAVGKLQKDSAVRFAQPNFLYTVAGPPEGEDPYANMQYGLRLVGADRARRLATGRGVTVAVLDSQVDSKHPDLVGAEVDHRDFFAEARWRQDEIHGTEMTGAIAARANNGVGISGIAPDATVISARVCGSPSSRGPEICMTDAIAQGLDYAIRQRARVVNMSLAGPYDPLVARLVYRAIEGRAAVVAAAGNNGPEGKPRFPAALDPVLAVSAVDQSEGIYASSNRGPHVDVAAAGVEVVTTSPGNAFRPSTGTSVAAAQVSGVVALLVEIKPDITPPEVKALLEATARDLGASGRDPLYGAGVVDACAAISRLSGETKACLPR